MPINDVNDYTGINVSTTQNAAIFELYAVVS